MGRASPPQRINVVGSSGSGKSTFSRRLARQLDLPYIEMDALFWRPNWKGAPDDEFLALVQEATDQPAWVLDGNYSRTQSIKWRSVQAVVWLDHSYPRTICRSIRRATSRALSQQELWPGTGNRETFRKSFFSRDSIILWAMSNYHKVKRRYEATIANPSYAHIQFVRLRSNSEVEAYLAGVARQPADGRP